MTAFRAACGLLLGLSLAACQTAALDQSAQPVSQPPSLAAASQIAPPPVSPERLIGLSGLDVLKLFGQPGLKRREAPAELWQYTASACVMDLYLYAEGEDLRVSYVTLRDPATGRVVQTGCQDQLARLSNR